VDEKAGDFYCRDVFMGTVAYEVSVGRNADAVGATLALTGPGASVYEQTMITDPPYSLHLPTGEAVELAVISIGSGVITASIQNHADLKHFL
jgi:hypothetical protein